MTSLTLADWPARAALCSRRLRFGMEKLTAL